MSRERLFELLCGWLAAITGGAVAAYAYVGNFIAPEAVMRDLLIYGVVLVLLVAGVTLDSVFNLPVGRLLLWAATILFVIIYSLSFLFSLLPSTLLAGLASFLAYYRRYVRPAGQTS